MKRTPLRSYTGFNKEKQIQSAKDMRERAQLKLREQGGINKVSEKQSIKNRALAKVAAEVKKESPYCARCAFYGRKVMGTQTHHVGGRVGSRMADKSLLVRVCDSCHFFIENNWNAAVAEGFMISKHQVTK